MLPNQSAHVNTLMGMLDQRQFAFDLSIMGSGKTFTATRMAYLRGLKRVIVICPASVIPKWKSMARHNPELAFIITSFQSLRSTKLHQPSHGLLYRREESMPKFQVTPLFTQYVEEGTLVVVDEIQNIKNVTAQLFAVQAMAIEVMKPGPSKLLMLSASPIDKVTQAVEVFRGLGILLEPLTQYNPALGSNVWTGLRAVHNFCLGINSLATRNTQVRQYYEPTNDPYVYRLFQAVLVKHCSSSMIPPPHPTAKLTKANAYYYIDQQGEEILQRGMHVLTTETNFNGQYVQWDAQRISSISRALQVIETGKIQLFVRITRDHLAANPQAKVVIAVNYTETLKDLRQLLSDFLPLSLEGCMSTVQREKSLRLFAEPSTVHRVMVCNQSVASTGIDLDDKDGNYPRLCLVNPTYSSIIAFQLGHRFLRMDTRSNAAVHFVFALRRGQTPSQCGDIVELKVLDALSRKSTVMRETTGMEVDDVQYPGEHEEFIES